MIGLGLSIVQLAIRAGLGFARGSSLALDFTSGNRTLDPRITFSRTTNATVTGSNGLIQYAPHNLLTHSEQFDNAAWSKTGVTVSANTVAAPNGALTADSLAFVAAPSNAFSYQNAATGTVTGRTFTFSCWLWSLTGKANITLRMAGLNTGTDSVTSVVALSSTPTRVSITRTFTSADTFLSCGFDNRTVFGADGLAGDVVVWGAQLEVGSTATTYNPTTVKNLLGFTENFDNAAWTKSNSFVQTNLFTYSEQFDNAVWSKNTTTVTANSTTAPDGSTTADTLVNTATTAAHSVSHPITTVSGNTFTMSFFVKKGTVRYIAIGLYFNASNNSGAGFDLDDGTVTGTGAIGTGYSASNATINSVGDGWYRISVVCTIGDTVANTARLFHRSVPYTSGTLVDSYAGLTSEESFIWGAQLVQGTSAGDYKATYAAAAAVGYTDIYGQPFAQKLVEDTATSVHRIFQAITPTTATTYTQSVYAKAGERRYFSLRPDGNANHATFDLQTGTVTDVNPGTTATITAVGNGWYRCTATRAASGGFWNAMINLQTSSDSANTYTGDGTSGIFIFGAQLSDSASVDPYVYQPVAAPTSTAYYGPRFDYDPVTLAPKGLLIEEQRTQLLTFSEQFDNAAWSKVDATVTANTAISPDGMVDAEKIIANSGVGSGQAAQTVSKAASAIQYTWSVYAKAGEWNSVGVYLTGSSFGNRGAVIVNLTTGAISTAAAAFGTFTGASATVTDAGNGWYRIALTVTSNTDLSVVCRVYPSQNGVFPNGDGTSGIFAWGAQLEQGSFSTSYIPTVASQVTRAADSASMIGNNFARWYNVTQGTLYAQGITSPRTTAVANAEHALSVSSTLSLLRGASSLSLGWFIGSGTFSSFNFTGANALFKSAGGYLAGNNTAAINGGSLVTDAGSEYGAPSSLSIGANALNNLNFNGHLARIAYYNRRLANTELVALTN